MSATQPRRQSSERVRPGQPAPTTRAERRRAELDARHAQRHRSHRQGNSNLVTFGAFGAIALVLLLFGAIFIEQMKGTSASTPVAKAAPALVNRTALNPNTDLLKTGSVAPNFTVKDMEGIPTSLVAERGHPVLLEFFAVWCPVCHRETSVIHQVTANYGAKNLHTLAILANPYGQNYETSQGKDLSIASRNDLVWYTKTYHANYPLLIDRNFAATNAYGAGSYPTIYVIDGKGKVAFAHQGYLPYKNLAAQVDRVTKVTK